MSARPLFDETRAHRPLFAETLDAPIIDVKAIAGSPGENIERFQNSQSLWAPPLLSADRAMNPIKDITDARSRDLVTGDAYMASGMAIQKDSIVGARYVLNAKPAFSILGLDEKWALEFQEEVETRFALVADSTENYFDVQRTKNFTDLVRLAVGIGLMTGEYLQTNEWIKDERPFATAVLPIELERLSNPYGQIDTPLLRRGIERNKRGRPTAYHIREAHPTDWTAYGAFVWNRVPARKPWGRPLVTHVVDHNRPDQSRAVSDLASAMSELQMMRKFRGVVLQSALVNATYAASIESELPSEVVFNSLGVGAKGQVGAQEAISNYANGYLGSIAAYIGNSKSALAIDGVKIPHLFPGTKLKLQPAQTGSGTLGSEFEASLLRYLAAALGVSHEELSRDFRGMNYTTMRGSISQTHRRMMARKTIFADRTASSIYRLWLEEEINNGRITSMPRNAPSFYEGLNSDAYTSCAWIGASRGQIDELKETQAAVLRIANNLSTLEDESARLGKDYRKILPQREREMAEEVKRGLPAAGATFIQETTQEDEDGSDAQNSGDGKDKPADKTASSKKDAKK